jgi:flagellar hook-associated protein 2
MTTLGIGSFGSGLDVGAIVTALVNADVAPKTNSLDRRESDLNAELSGIGALKSALSSLEGSLATLSNGTIFDAVTIDSPDSVTVTQTGSPSVGS